LTALQRQQRLRLPIYSFVQRITKKRKGAAWYLLYPRVQIMGRVPKVLMGRQVRRKYRRLHKRNCQSIELSCLSRAYSDNLLSRNPRPRVALLL
jgi:hypothetical protein